MNPASSDLTRASLISRARSRDSQAWTELVDLYGPLIAHWCSRCGLSRDQVADAMQEVFASVSKSLDGFVPQKTSGSFRSWLWTITSNQVKDLHRRTRNQPLGKGGSTALAEMAEISAEEIPNCEPTESFQMGMLLERALEQVRTEFEPQTWDIFRRSVVDQIATAIVAREFSVSAAAVRQVRSRVLRRLRQQLGDLE